MNKQAKYQIMTHEEVLLLQEALAKKPLFFRIEVSAIALMLGFIMVLVISLTDVGQYQTAFLLAIFVILGLGGLQFWKNYYGRAKLRKDLIHREKRLTRVKLTKKERQYAPDFQLIYLSDRKLPIIVEAEFYDSVERGMRFDIWRSRYANECLTTSILGPEGQTASLNRRLTNSVLVQAQQEWNMAQQNEQFGKWTR